MRRIAILLGALALAAAWATPARATSIDLKVGDGQSSIILLEGSVSLTSKDGTTVDLTVRTSQGRVRITADVEADAEVKLPASLMLAFAIASGRHRPSDCVNCTGIVFSNVETKGNLALTDLEVKQIATAIVAAIGLSVDVGSAYTAREAMQAAADVAALAGLTLLFPCGQGR